MHIAWLAVFMSLDWSERTPMDFETTLSTIAAMLPDELEEVVTTVTSYFPDQLQQVIRHASAYLPTQIDMGSAALFMLYFAVGSLILGVIGRIFLGKRSSLNHSLSSVMGIFFIYALTAVIYTFKPWNLTSLISPLPFVTFSGEYMIILPILDAHFPALCAEVLALIILAFLVNLLDVFIPRGKTVIGWYLLRFVTVVFCMLLHLAVRWAFHRYLPDVLVTYAPAILLVLLFFMLFSGILSLILGLLIAVTNPFLGAMYTFFFTSVVGKQLSKAIFTSAILCSIFYLLEISGYTVICITAHALLAFIPLALILLLLWYLIGHVL